ncbi:hypothetical protein Barb4_00131 [Bacteroidales bacterium Barb4]|nr:hypothetical protein Barb4_00131 [Bacteroidales bacterium Barb4]
MFRPSAVNQRDTIQQHFHILPRHAHHLHIRFAQCHIVGKAKAQFGVQHGNNIRCRFLPKNFLANRPHLKNRVPERLRFVLPRHHHFPERMRIFYQRNAVSLRLHAKDKKNQREKRKQDFAHHF